jgi:hypothetical protein
MGEDSKRVRKLRRDREDYKSRHWSEIVAERKKKRAEQDASTTWTRIVRWSDMPTAGQPMGHDGRLSRTQRARMYAE